MEVLFVFVFVFVLHFHCYVCTFPCQILVVIRVSRSGPNCPLLIACDLADMDGGEKILEDEPLLIQAAK